MRQGCPLSPLLYVLTMEVLAVNIRANPAIVGLQLPNSLDRLPVLSLYADDTSIISTSDDATRATFQTYARFEKGSGAKLNMDKCEGLWLGAWRSRLDAPVPIQWTSDKIKTLGVYIGNGCLDEANWKPRLEAVIFGRPKRLGLSHDVLVSGPFRGKPCRGFRPAFSVCSWPSAAFLRESHSCLEGFAGLILPCRLDGWFPTSPSSRDIFVQDVLRASSVSPPMCATLRL